MLLSLSIINPIVTNKSEKGEGVMVDKSGGKLDTREIPLVLQKIAICESGGSHYDKDGSILRGKINPKDIGKYQINEKYWKEKAEKLGFDIYSEEGNELMAFYIYEKNGTTPWNWSKKCWSKL